MSPYENTHFKYTEGRDSVDTGQIKNIKVNK